VTGRWVSPGTPVSPTNKTDLHNIIEILFKVALNTITLTHYIMKRPRLDTRMLVSTLVCPDLVSMLSRSNLNFYTLYDRNHI